MTGERAWSHRLMLAFSMKDSRAIPAPEVQSGATGLNYLTAIFKLSGQWPEESINSVILY